MKIVITGQNIKISDQLNEKLRRSLINSIAILMTNLPSRSRFDREANKISAEITMKIHKHYYRAEALMTV